MKKSIALILSVLMMATMLVGCASGGDSAYSIEQLTGTWTGTSTFVEASNAEEFQTYLEGLYGISFTEEQAATLLATNASDMFEVIIYDYDDEETGKTYPGSWEMGINMGDFFGWQEWTDWDAISYDEYANDRDAGCIVLDSANSFCCDVVETDYLGEYGAILFGVEDSMVAEDGKYGLSFTGTVSEGANGTQIVGQMILTLQYGDMSQPYKMVFDYTLDSMTAN